MTVRVRYAPSPTGDPHVGNIRTALWTWLHARRHGGTFILRLEDTDQSRAQPGSLERIMSSLRWLGLDWDEGPEVGGAYGPYVQSERLPLYHEATDRLLRSGHAYRCFCSEQRLHDLREQQRTASRPTGYDGHCRTIAPEEAATRAATEPHVVRFAMPREGSTSFTDLLRGEITVENAQLDDFVILKSDRFPTYHLASVVDDHHMEITHITRGDEWIPSTPRHVRLYEALGWEMPIVAHTPVILGPDGGKLSKRHGAKSVLEYAAEGYLPEALFNFLAITGWALDDHTELFTREQLSAVFDLADLSRNPGVFDTQKLEWMNGVYMRQLSIDRAVHLFVERLDNELPRTVRRPLDETLVRRFTPLILERVRLLSDVAAMVDFFFHDDVPTPPIADLLGKRYNGRAGASVAALDAAAAALDALTAWEVPGIEAALRAAAEGAGEKAGDLFMLCRLAVTGKQITPPLFESMEIVGRERSLARIRRAADAARAHAAS